MGKAFVRILLMLTGILMVILGIGTFRSPDTVIWTVGAGVMLYGLGAILNWIEKSRVGFAQRTALASACMTVVVGIVILSGEYLGFLATGIMMIILSLWLIAVGVMEIVGAVIYRKAMTTADLGVQAPGSIVSMVLGAVFVLTGLFSLIEPLFAVFAAGIVTSIVLIVIGIRIVVSGIYSGILIRREG